MSDEKTILKQIGKAVLIRIDSEVEVGDKSFRGVEYEIWSDVDKMKSGIRTDENGKSYVKSISSLTNDEPIKLFEALYGNQE
jgi:hypothetical protein